MPIMQWRRIHIKKGDLIPEAKKARAASQSPRVRAVFSLFPQDGNSQIGSATLRRLAWFRGKPMSKTLEVLLEATGLTMAEMRPGDVCSKCRDKSICGECPFHSPAEKKSATETSEKTA